MYFIQHGFICRPSDSPVLEAGVEPIGLLRFWHWLDLDYIFILIFFWGIFYLHFPSFLSHAVADKQGPSIEQGKKRKKDLYHFSSQLTQPQH